MLLVGSQFLGAQVIINEFVAANSDRLLQRETGTYPRPGVTTPWQFTGYDDSLWSSGPGPFGFGTPGTIATDLSAQMRNRVPSLYLRKTFDVTVAQAASDATLQLLTRFNDGFIAYLNGVEVARRNLGNPGMFVFHDQTTFSIKTSNPSLEIISLGAANTRLVAGENLLCIQAHNHELVGDTAANFIIQADLQISGVATLVTNNSTWKYFPGVAEPSGGVLDYGLCHQFLQEGAAVPWATRGFNDATWLVGPGPVGIEGTMSNDYSLGVNLYAQTYNVTPTIYIRRVFTITPTEALSEQPLRLTIDYDDGLIVYLNGKEVARRNVGVPGIPASHDELATASHSANGDNGGTVTGQEEILLIAPPKNLLWGGENVLAVQLHRASLTSTDAVARVTLETTGDGARVLALPSDMVRCFAGVTEPLVPTEEDEGGESEESPDSENDWVELYNPSGDAVSLAGWSLTDKSNNLRQWMFPTNTVIPAGGYLLVLATGLDTSPEKGATFLHASFSLSAQGEYLALVNAAGQVVSELSPAYPAQNHFHSYGRDTNGDWGFFAQATPGGPNTGVALAPPTAAPSFSAVGGFYDSTLTLTLGATNGASIRYTLDGSEPNPGLLYSNPLAITNDCVVRARAVLAGAVPSPVLTHTYLLNETAAKKSVPALCLSGDPALTFYGPNTSGGPTNGEGFFAIKGGVYIGGVWWQTGDPGEFFMPAMRGRAHEKPAVLEYFPVAGEVLRTELGLRIAGSSYSRSRFTLTDPTTNRFTIHPTQKPSFNLFFRSEWGERPLEYPFFDDSPVKQFYDVRLRAGKNDMHNLFITDELIRRMYLGTGQKSSVGLFNTVYVNGVFKGYFNLCERLREGFMQKHYQSSEAWDVQMLNEFSSGDPIHWNEMIAYLRSANLTNTASYAQVHNYLDVDNYIDYILVNAYSAMWDWPHNNWAAARERSAAGRWRFYVWDAEGGFGLTGHPITYNSFTNDLIISYAQTTTSQYVQALFTWLRVSPEFQLRFADRVQKHFFNGGGLVRTNLQAIYAKLRDAINPIMLETIGGTVYEPFYNDWILNDTRRDIFFGQLAGQNFWPTVLAPGFSHYGGPVTPGLVLTLTNPNASGTIYYSTNGSDPRSPGGAVAGQVYTGDITVSQSTLVQARVLDTNGVWSPVIEATFVIPPAVPTFLPGGSADWTTNANWSSAPAAYPSGAGGVAVIPPPAGSDRNVNLRASVAIGQINFPQASSAVRNRVRDQGAGNTLTFQSTNGPARIEVGGTGGGYVEFEVLAGSTLQSDLQLHVTNVVGNPEYGALRLRANWSGPGGLIKSGLGVASLTGDAKTYTGSTVIEQGVLLMTQPAAPVASMGILVQPGGQLRLTSGNDGTGPRLYQFGGPLSLAGLGRGMEIPDNQSQGKLGALRYDPGGQSNQAVISNPVLLTGAAGIHVDGSGNTLELAGPLSGPYSLAKSGGGTLRLSTNNAAHTAPIQVDNGTLELAGGLGASVSVASPATLTGYGQVGSLGGTGAIRLNQTLLRSPSVSGLTNQFVFGQSGSPAFLQPAASGNGLLVLSSPPVVPSALDLYVTLNPLLPGASLRGGYWVPFNVNLSAALNGVTPRVFVADAGGTHAFNNQLWSPLAGAQITTVAETANFGQGLEQGRTLELRVGGPPVTFDAWRLQTFPNPDDFANPLISGPSASPQGDGVPNLLRYSFGMTLADVPSDFAPKFVGSATTPAIRFRFDSGRNDLGYRVEVTPDVADWSAGTVLFDSRTDFPPTAESGWITVSDPTPAEQQRFYRVSVFLLAE